MEKAYQWLEYAGLKATMISASALIMVALNTRLIKAYHTRPKVQTVQRCPGNNTAGKSRVQDAGRKRTWNVTTKWPAWYTETYVPSKGWRIKMGNKKLVANQLDIVVVNMQDKKLAMVDVAIPSNINIKEHKKLKKYQGLKEMERVCGE